MGFNFNDSVVGRYFKMAERKSAACDTSLCECSRRPVSPSSVRSRARSARARACAPQRAAGTSTALSTMEWHG